MAITTIDQAIAGMQWPRFIAKAATGTLVAGRPQSLWPVAGSPGAGAYDTTAAGVALTAPVNGQIPWTDPVSGNAYLARLQASASQACTLVLADRLWHNGGITINTTGAQTINSAAFPARDNNGATAGAGVLVGIETSAAASATAVAATLTYTNSAGTGSRTATLADATAATATIAGAFFRFGLQAGDIGVQSIQSINFTTAWTTGTVNLVAYRPLVALELVSSLVPAAIDALTSGFPRQFNGTVPYFFLIPSATTSTSVSGQVVFTHG